MNVILSKCGDIFPKTVEYLNTNNPMGDIYVTGYCAKLFYNYLKQTKFNRPVHLVYWNFQFRKANIIVRFLPDLEYGIEREILTENDIKWERENHLQLRGYF